MVPPEDDFQGAVLWPHRAVEPVNELLILSQFRITMAAIDPSAAPVYAGTANDNIPPRATLKLIRQDYDVDDDEGEDFANDDDDDLSEDDNEEANGGPSDPSKSKGLHEETSIKQLLKAFAENKSESDDDDDEDEDMELDGVNGVDGINGIISKIKKGKGKATDDDDDDSDEDDLMNSIGLQEFVICTLDPEKVSIICSCNRPGH